MGKKKGKKGKKGPKIDPEEAARIARRAELVLELQMGEANQAIQRKVWREKLIKMHLPVIKEDLQAAWHTFDRATDNKNYSISLLLDGLEDADSQKQRSDALHMEQIDRLLEIYKQQLRKNDDYFQTRISNALDVINEQMTRTEDEQKYENDYLRTVKFAIEEKAKENTDHLKSKIISTLDTQKEASANLRRMARTMMKRRMRSHTQEIAAVIQDYEERTKKLRKEYDAIKEKDDEDQRTIERQSKRIATMFKTIAILRKQIDDFRETTGKDIADYRFERDYYQKAYMTIQHRLLREQIEDKEQLVFATIQFKKTMDFLKRCETKLDKSFSTMDLCKKYETFDDKLFVYPISTVDNCIDFEILTPDFEWECVDDIIEYIQPMKKFLKNIMNVEKQLIILQAQFHRLSEESKNFKSMLKDYMCAIEQPRTGQKVDHFDVYPITIDLCEVMKLRMEQDPVRFVNKKLNKFIVEE